MSRETQVSSEDVRVGRQKDDGEGEGHGEEADEAVAAGVRGRGAEDGGELAAVVDEAVDDRP